MEYIVKVKIMTVISPGLLVKVIFDLVDEHFVDYGVYPVSIEIEIPAYDKEDL